MSACLSRGRALIATRRPQLISSQSCPSRDLLTARFSTNVPLLPVKPQLFTQLECLKRVSFNLDYAHNGPSERRPRLVDAIQN